MPKPMTPEEAEDWFRKNKDAIKRRLAQGERAEDLAEDLKRGGLDFGPPTELDYRRMIREIQESGGEDE
jgi:hypothetical protein